MVTKTIKTTSGPLVISIPASRDEISIGLLQALTPEPGHSFSQLETLSILSGISLDSGYNSDSDIDLPGLYDIINMDDLSYFDETLQLLAYQLKAFVEVQDIPDGVVLDIPQAQIKRWFGRREHKGKYVPVLKNLGIQPAGAYMEAKELIKGQYELWERVKKEYGEDIEFNPSIESQIRLLSLYLYCPATGEKFNTVKVSQFDEVIKNLSITKALPIARYFFLKYPNLSKPKVAPSLDTLKKLIRKQV